MSRILTCANGHQYDAERTGSCPYCPKTSLMKEGSATQKTSVMGRTEVMDGRAVGGTAPARGMGDTVPMDVGAAGHGGTVIFRPGGEVARQRKLVGFLVSYDLDEQGKSFSLFEGRNLIGTDRSCDIVIDHAPSVSGKHLTILYRNNTFLFKDEFSTNGTRVDGEMKNDGELDRNCLITIGEVNLCFIRVPFELTGQK